MCKDLLSAQKGCVNKKDVIGVVPLEALCRSQDLTQHSVDIAEQVS